MPLFQAVNRYVWLVSNPLSVLMLSISLLEIISSDPMVSEKTGRGLVVLVVLVLEKVN